MVEGEENPGLGVPIADEAEIPGQHLEELRHGEAGIEQGSKQDLLGSQEIPQAFQHHGFAGADLAGHHHEALAALDAVDQVGQRLLVMGAPEKERRIRAQIERVFGKAEKRLVHVQPHPAGGSRRRARCVLTRWAGSRVWRT